MNIEDVVDVFTRLSGLAAEDIIKFRFMCLTSYEYVKSHTKSGTDMSVYGGRLAFAAAALAYYRYILWCLTDGDGSEIKVGDISVKPVSEKQLDSADKLCRNAFSALSGVFDDGSFVFERI